MGKLPLLKPLQICLSKFKGSKMCEEDGPWRFSCGHPKTQSFSLERSGECTSGEEEVYRNFNSVYVVSDLKPGCASESLCALPEEKGGGGGEFGSRESQRFVICYDDGNYSCKSWFYEEEVTSKSSSYLSDYFSESSRSSELPAGFVSGLSSKRFFFSPAGRSNSILEEAKALGYSVDGAQDSPPLQREKIDLSLCMDKLSESDGPGNSSWDLSSTVADPSRVGDEYVLQDPLSYVLQDRLSLTQRDLCDMLLSDSVAVPMHSPNPYLDFRKSMQEMVEAHNLRDWSYLQEMLFCYLRLNKKKTHKFIVGAFADLLVNIVATTTPLLEYTARKDTD